MCESVVELLIRLVGMGECLQTGDKMTESHRRFAVSDIDMPVDIVMD